MSLRTKLLAVVIGLNGLILLLALYLLVNTEPGTSPSALVHLLRDRRADVGANLARWTDAVDGVWLVEVPLKPAGAGGEGPPAPRVYDFRAWVQAPAFSLTQPLPDGPARATALAAWERRQAPGAPDVEQGTVVRPLEAERSDTQKLWLVAQLREAQGGARDVYLVMLGGLLALAVVAFLVISRVVVRPLAALTDAAGRVAAGERVRLPEPEADDELGRATAAFNRMAREIEEYQTHLEERVLTSLSRIKKAEQHLAIAERLAATGKLAAGIAHEINNPLGGMKNAVRALARGDLEPAKTSEYLELIGDGLLRVEETVKKVLAFTPRRVEPRPIDLSDVVQKALALARHRIEKKGIRVEGQAPADDRGRVFGDPLELQQVALNLLLNAADAVAEGPEGRIEVEVAPWGAEEVVLRVTDNGSGMSPEVQARCFDLFFTTKEVGEGTGLGLSVVHNIVSNHGGHIELESTPGKGTTFRVFLPRETGPLEPAPGGEAPPGRRRRPRSEGSEASSEPPPTGGR